MIDLRKTRRGSQWTLTEVRDAAMQLASKQTLTPSLRAVTWRLNRHSLKETALLAQSKILGGLLLAAGLAPNFALAQDAVTAMCMEHDTEAVCNCASKALRNEIGAEDYAIYEAIGENYLSRMENGEGRVDAWMAASRTEAEKRGIGSTALMARTNEIGNAHRAAIKSCGG